jgi:hypothetical protein
VTTIRRSAVKKKSVLIVALLATVFGMGAISLDYGTAPDKNFQKKYGTVVASDLACASAATVYSDIFPIGSTVEMGVWCRATSAAGTPDVTFTLETAPTKELANFAELTGGGWSLAVNDELPHPDLLPTKACNWGRIKIVGGGTNPSDTLIDIVINRAR